MDCLVALSTYASATSSPNKGYSSAIALKQEDESMAPTKSSGGVDDDHRVAASGTWRHEGTTTTATIIVGAKIITQESDPHHTHRSAYSYFSTFITTIYPSHAMVAIPTSPPMVTEVEENGQGRNDDGVAKQILSLLGPCDFACPSHAPL
ncbi:hypothetical protein BCR42DRAFT_440746 [Absidia repens]|uniref:Uncharacterized protein n=1 Tax=Absidia repens TaxID=90262 RepID=A0A1X2I7Q5_9FUNG|nr:hypothetical protein BCR42DRAFT_440746 [Absidia repens]